MASSLRDVRTHLSERSLLRPEPPLAGDRLPHCRLPRSSSARSPWRCRRSSFGWPMSGPSRAPSGVSPAPLPLLACGPRRGTDRRETMPRLRLPLRPADLPRRPRLRGRSLLLAPVDPQHERRQRDFPRHPGTGLGGPRLRLSHRRARRPRGGLRARCSASPAPPLWSGRATASPPTTSRETSMALPRRSFSAPISLPSERAAAGANRPHRLSLLARFRASFSCLSHSSSKAAFSRRHSPAPPRWSVSRSSATSAARASSPTPSATCRRHFRRW